MAAEVDEILLSGLKEIGCTIETGIRTLKQLLETDPFVFYQGCAAYIKAVEPQREQIPDALPSNLSGRTNACTAVATAMKEMGYRGDLSFHQILYPNESEVRHLLMFLVKVYNEWKSSREEPTSKRGEDLLSDLIGREFTALAKETWMPMYCTTRPGKPKPSAPLHAIVIRTPARTRSLTTVPGLQSYYTQFLPPVTAQVHDIRSLPAAVLETNLSILSETRERDTEYQTGLDSGLNPQQYRLRKRKVVVGNMAKTFQAALAAAGDSETSASRLSSTLNTLMQAYEQNLKRGEGGFGRKVKYGQQESEASVETAEERLAKQNKELEEQQASLATLNEEIEQVEGGMQNFVAKMRQIEADMHEADQKREPLEKEYRLKKRTYDLLPEADTKIEQLHKIIDTTKDHLLELATEWEKHRTPLIAELRKLTDMQHEAQGESRGKLEEVKMMRVEMKHLVDEIRQKDERYKQLVEVFKGLGTEMNRTAYTRRILEIVKNVKKQKVDINKILEDTRVLQKDINSVTEKLGRSFAVTEEMVYQDAKKESAKGGAGANLRTQAYKSLKGINDNFTSYVKVLEDIGSTANSILNLEAKIEQIQSRTSTLNMERVEADLKQMRADNSRLKLRLLEVSEGRADPGPTEAVVSTPSATAAADTVVSNPLFNPLSNP
ncbi:coiled-coil domain-containing protein 22 [Pelomyxa schiedti]|nr:coiled-coil domain-containing protein 22 [Pelomyxa schiedti]